MFPSHVPAIAPVHVWKMSRGGQQMLSRSLTKHGQGAGTMTDVRWHAVAVGMVLEVRSA